MLARTSHQSFNLIVFLVFITLVSLVLSRSESLNKEDEFDNSGMTVIAVFIGVCCALSMTCCVLCCICYPPRASDKAIEWNMK